jgi:hypothetical protein
MSTYRFYVTIQVHAFTFEGMIKFDTCSMKEWAKHLYFYVPYPYELNSDELRKHLQNGTEDILFGMSADDRSYCKLEQGY